jgi:tRNA(Ile)-lysidine synthase
MTKARAEAAQPLRDDELAALFKDFPRNGRIIVAISGGADSTALLVLAARWRELTAGAPELIAATIDHRLRKGSAREAKAVAALAQRLGIAHHTLAWTREKPTTGIEAAARAARYTLLGRLAKRVKAEHVATAHTLDDQAETVLLRFAAGSGPAGLAGIRPVDRRDGLILVRPLLGVAKLRLEASLRAANIPWAEDPMNRDPGFARPRLRAVRAALESEGLTAERLARLAARMLRYEAVVEAVSAAPVAGPLDGRQMAAGLEEVAIRRLSAAIRAARGGGLKPHVPRLEQVEALWKELKAAFAAGKRVRRTLAGLVIVADAAGIISVSPAPARRGAKTTKKRGETARPARSVHQD